MNYILFNIYDFFKFMNILGTDMTVVLDFLYLCQQLCWLRKMSLSMVRTIRLNKSMTKAINYCGFEIIIYIFKKFYLLSKITDWRRMQTVGSIFSHPGLNLFLTTLLLSCCKYIILAFVLCQRLTRYLMLRFICQLVFRRVLDAVVTDKVLSTSNFVLWLRHKSSSRMLSF